MMDANRLAALSTEVTVSSPVWGAVSAVFAHLVARSERHDGVVAVA